MLTGYGISGLEHCTEPLGGGGGDVIDAEESAAFRAYLLGR